MKIFQEQYRGTLLENIFEEARPHGNQNIGISSQKLAFVIISYSKQNCCEL